MALVLIALTMIVVVGRVVVELIHSSVVELVFYRDFDSVSLSTHDRTGRVIGFWALSYGLGDAKPLDLM